MDFDNIIAIWNYFFDPSDYSKIAIEFFVS